MIVVFRIEKTRSYIVMSNYHLRNTRLLLKFNGLLSIMLPLTEDWNYTTRDLAKISKESTAVWMKWQSSVLKDKKQNSTLPL